MAREKYLVDTNVIIGALRGDKKCKAFLETSNHKIFVAKVTQKELLQKRGLTIQEKTRIRNTVEQFTIISLDNKVLFYFSLLKIEFLKQNLWEEKHDRLIAATALAKKLPLVTYNIKHFSFVKGLKLLRLK